MTMGKNQYSRLLRASLPIVMILMLAGDCVSHEKKIVPDGTTGILLEVGPDDYLKEKRPANEFEGSLSTMRVGLGYIMDAATYSQDAVFKKQMDSAGLAFDPATMTGQKP